LVTTDMGRKLGGCPFGGGGAGSSSNTMWPGPSPTSTPSFILTHPAVWPQYANVTDRQTGQTDNSPIEEGETFYKQSRKNPTRPEVAFSGQMVVDKSIYCVKVEQEVGFCEFVYAVFAIFLLPVWPEMAVSGLYSPVMRALRCVVTSRRA